MNLNTNPEAILIVDIGAEVHLDGFILRVENASEGIFLTTVTSRPDEFNRLNEQNLRPAYHEFVQHFRAADPGDAHAVMKRRELLRRLRDGSYTIS